MKPSTHVGIPANSLPTVILEATSHTGRSIEEMEKSI